MLTGAPPGCAHNGGGICACCLFTRILLLSRANQVFTMALPRLQARLQPCMRLSKGAESIHTGRSRAPCRPSGTNMRVPSVPRRRTVGQSVVLSRPIALLARPLVKFMTTDGRPVVEKKSQDRGPSRSAWDEMDKLTKAAFRKARMNKDAAAVRQILLQLSEKQRLKVWMGASMHDNDEWIRDLLVDEFGVDVDAVSELERQSRLKRKASSHSAVAGQTALMRAAGKGQFGTVQHLLRLGADVECEILGRSALGYAAMSGSLHVVRTLLENGAIVNPSSIQLAVVKNQPDILKLLLDASPLPERKSLVNAMGVGGETALTDAALRGCLDCAKLLLNALADPHKPDGRGRTPIGLALNRGHSDVARLLLDYGAQLPPLQFLRRCKQSVLNEFYPEEDVEKLFREMPAQN